MRSFLAAALVAAAFVPAAAHADSGDCLDPLLTSSAPRFVYYNPEIGGYYVDVDAAQSFAGAQPGRAVAVARCLAGTMPATRSAQDAPADCLHPVIGQQYPAPEFVGRDDQGRIWVDPSAGDPTVLRLVTAVLCLV